MMIPLGLFVGSAILELTGSYLAIKFMRTYDPAYFISAVIVLTVFGLSLAYHPEESGRVFAVYGGIYIFASLIWLKVIDNADITRFDVIGVGLAVIGSLIIFFQPS